VCVCVCGRRGADRVAKRPSSQSKTQRHDRHAPTVATITRLCSTCADHSTEEKHISRFIIMTDVAMNTISQVRIRDDTDTELSYTTNAYSMVTNIARPNTVTWKCCHVTRNNQPVVSCQPTVRWLPMLPQFDLQTKYQSTPHFLAGHVECGSDGVRLNEHECLADRSTQFVGVGHNFSVHVHAWHHAVMECQRGTNRVGSAPMTGLAKGASRTMQHACEATRDSKGAPLQPCHHVARHCDRQKEKIAPC
jgi:hypothetical protein